jgi:dTDP-L-rhamnose 4-epimerase
MSELVLITGGAGFIGSHLTDALLARGHRVRVLDNLTSQVHGPGALSPPYLSREAEVRLGDVRDPVAVRKALVGVDVVVHLASATGVNRSMYELQHYVATNGVGTSVLLEALLERPVRRLVVASSMSVYGEGRCRRPDGRLVAHARRTRAQLERGEWEPLDDETGLRLTPVPTPEGHPCELTSVYALSKFDQERLCLMIGAAYAIPTVALRLFNVFGPRQALSNPYTGVVASFASRLLNARQPVLFEDGRQRRDFVSVHDVARAFCLALERDGAAGEVFNVGSGQPRTVAEVALALGRVLGKERHAPEVTGEHRAGDVRHCFADITKARQRLGYAPEVPFEQALEELAEWLRDQRATDRVAVARAELSSRGLTLGSSEAA